MSLYQPSSRAISHRDMSGCLTPQGEPKEISNKGEALLLLGNSNSILSPPLSPYQKVDEEQITEPVSKQYLPTKSPFKIENYKNYQLTVNPWNNKLTKNYKKNQLSFLQKYSVLSSKELMLNNYRIDKRNNYKKKFVSSFETNNSNSDSDSNLERVRTRRIIKDTNSDIELTSPLVKKKKVRKEPPVVGSSLALQQASFIDENIPDYSPDANSTLPKGNNRSLKVEWKGQPMDLRNDVNLDKLHPAEVLLASTLRLPCNVYLDSKRRLFFEKVSRLRKGMQFRRTDAQKACRIDVNKASRLFAAFEKVGWLNNEHFEKYL